MFADIDDEIFCLHPDSVEANITPRTLGIMVNLYGHPAPLMRLREIPATLAEVGFEEARKPYPQHLVAANGIELPEA